MLEKVEEVNIQNEEILHRVANSVKAKNTEHYVAKINRQEIGFISVDSNEGVDYLVLYEIFIPHSFRGKGYGSKLLEQVVVMAKNLGYKRVTVNPEPFEKDFPKEILIKWYQKNGFSEMKGNTGEFEKNIE